MTGRDGDGGPERTLWLDPCFGASGDMLLGALVGLGADVETLVACLETLAIDGWSLTATTVTRGGLGAHRVEVSAEVDAPRHWSTIDGLLARSEDLPEAVRLGARSTFRRLGEIEAEAHGVDLDDVHFHEVGAIDAIVDIVGTWVALDLLSIDRVIVGPVGLGHGTVTGSHGILPLPAPATAALLAGAPVRSLDVELETCTPTGAALLATIGSWGPMPSGTLLATSRGAGGRDPRTHPNVLTGHLLVTDPISAAPAPTPGPDDAASPAVILATNLDDVTPEVLGHVVDRLLAEGADDAWIVPILMKKQRPAHQLCVLTSAERAPHLQALIGAETGTLGIRRSDATKYAVPRSFEQIELHGGTITIKVGPHGAKPEHDDLVALAATTGLPLRELSMQALARWRDISRP